MLDSGGRQPEQAIPGKRYFNIGEVSKLCDVPAYVLRYWEQEFPQLSPIKRRGNRRYYQRREVETIRLIKYYLYEEGFTINGARKKLENGINEPIKNLKFHSQDIEEIEREIHELIDLLHRE